MRPRTPQFVLSESTEIVCVQSVEYNDGSRKSGGRVSVEEYEVGGGLGWARGLLHPSTSTRLSRAHDDYFSSFFPMRLLLPLSLALT